MGSWSRRGRGGLIGSPACPWGQREGPAQLGVPLTLLLPGPPLPSRVPGQGMSCSRRSLLGARGQGGLGGVLPSSPPHLLPAQVRAGAATTTAAPDSRRPRAGAAQGVGQGEGLGVPRAESGRAGAIWWPCPARAPPAATWPWSPQPPGGRAGPPCQGGRRTLGGRWESGLRSCGKGMLFPEF